jgi:ethylmalonyl-CoA mutase
MDAKVADLVEAAQAELDHVLELGGAVAAVDYMKSELVRSNAERLRRIESGDQKVIGVNAFTTAEPSPLVDEEGGILVGRRCGRVRADRPAGGVAPAATRPP